MALFRPLRGRMAGTAPPPHPGLPGHRLGASEARLPRLDRPGARGTPRRAESCLSLAWVRDPTSRRYSAHYLTKVRSLSWLAPWMSPETRLPVELLVPEARRASSEGRQSQRGS